MHFLDFVFFVKYSKEETSHYQAFGNQNIDLSFVKQCQVISCNLFLLYIYIYNLSAKKPLQQNVTLIVDTSEDIEEKFQTKSAMKKMLLFIHLKFFYIATREYYYAQIESNKK